MSSVDGFTLKTDLLLDAEEGWNLTPPVGGCHGPSDSIGGHTVVGLRVGLCRLYQEVRCIETQHAPLWGALQARQSREIPPRGELNHVWCCHHWYATTLCNHGRLVAKLANASDHRAYMRGVAPSVVKYRDKVAAHFAFTDPRSDNEADQERSLLPDADWTNDGRYEVGGGKWAIHAVGNPVVESEHDYQWSLTKQHETMAARYDWPAQESARPAQT